MKILRNWTSLKWKISAQWKTLVTEWKTRATEWEKTVKIHLIKHCYPKCTQKSPEEQENKHSDKKNGKDLNRYFTKDDVHHMSLEKRKLKQQRATTIHLDIWGYSKMGIPIHCWLECKMVHFGRQFGSPYKAKHPFTRFSSKSCFLVFIKKT